MDMVDREIACHKLASPYPDVVTLVEAFDNRDSIDNKSVHYVLELCSRGSLLKNCEKMAEKGLLISKD